jgi:hypothetical protein
VSSALTSVSLPELNSGAGGKLALTGAVTEVTIGGGTGNVEFSNATGTLTALSLENTGTIAFNHGAAALSIPDAVQAVFGGDVTLAGGISTGAASSTSKITFKGNVTLADGKAITIAESDTASAVTLKAGKSIYAGANRVVTAVTDIAFTAGVDGATLTAAVSTKTLTVGTQALTLTSGALAVEAGAKLTLGKVLTVAAGAELGVQGEVSVVVTDGGLTLTAAEADGGAKLSGSGKVTAGSTEIVGAWQAVGASGTIAITYATTVTTITGAATNALTAITASLSDNPVITQKSGAGNALTIAANTVIDLATGGSIVLKKQTASETVATLTFTAATSIVKAGSGAATNSVTNGVLTTALAANGATGAAAENAIEGKAAGSGPSTLTQIIGDSSKSITGPTSAATGDCTISSNLAVTGS